MATTTQNRRKNFKIALVQMNVIDDKEENLKKAVAYIREAYTKYQPRIICLPECFNCPYNVGKFKLYAESIPDGITSKMLSNVAKELNVYIVGGSIPEIDENNSKIIYNTSPVFGPDGKFVTKHRKVHLFDMDVKNVYSFKESDGFTPGNSITMFNVDGVKIGLCICMDVYFDEFAKLYRKNGCELMIIPSAFQKQFGMEWDLHNRSRASDNQFYLATNAPSTDPDSCYVAWGHSMIVDPWGNVIATAKSEEQIISAEINLAEIEICRKSVPIFDQRRTDIYDTIYKAQ